MRNFVEKQILELGLSFSKVNYNTMGALRLSLVSCAKRKSTIILSAVGKNTGIAQKFVSSLISASISARFLHSNDALHGEMGMVKPGDVVVMVSKSGKTEEILSLASYLIKIPHLEIWLLTCSPDAVKDSIFSNILYIPMDNEGDPWNLLPNNSSTIFLITLQALFLALLKDLKITQSLLTTNHPGGVIGKILLKQNK